MKIYRTLRSYDSGGNWHTRLCGSKRQYAALRHEFMRYKHSGMTIRLEVADIPDDIWKLVEEE